MNFYLWTDKLSRWVSLGIHDSIKDLFVRVCKSTLTIKSEVKYCQNIISRSDRDNCTTCFEEKIVKPCQGINCTNVAIYFTNDYKICEECSLKHNLTIKNQGCEYSIWVANDSRWFDSCPSIDILNYCKGVEYINGIKKYCSNLIPPKKNKCYSCEDSIPVFKGERWITPQTYLKRVIKSSKICAFSPFDGENVGKICGNVYVRSNDKPLENRCIECDGKLSATRELFDRL